MSKALVRPGQVIKGDTNILMLYPSLIAETKTQTDFKYYLRCMRALNLDMPTEFMLCDPTNVINQTPEKQKAAEAIVNSIYASWKKAGKIQNASIECFDLFALSFATHIAHAIRERGPGRDISIFLRPRGEFLENAYHRLKHYAFTGAYPQYYEKMSTTNLFLQIQTFNKKLEGGAEKVWIKERVLRADSLGIIGDRTEPDKDLSLIGVIGYTSFLEASEARTSPEKMGNAYCKLISETPQKASAYKGIVTELSKELEAIKGKDDFIHLYGTNPETGKKTHFKAKVKKDGNIEIADGKLSENSDSNLINMPDGEIFFMHPEYGEGEFYVDHFFEGTHIRGLFTLKGVDNFTFKGKDKASEEIVEKYLSGALKEEFGPTFLEVGIGWMPQIPRTIKATVVREKECGVHIGIGNPKSRRHIDFTTTVDRIVVGGLEIVRKDYAWTKKE